MGFFRPSLNVVIYYLPHSGLEMCKIDIDCMLDPNFLDCLALTFCDIIGDFLPERAQFWTTFCLTPNVVESPVPRVRKISLTKYYSILLTSAPLWTCICSNVETNLSQTCLISGL